MIEFSVFQALEFAIANMGEISGDFIVFLRKGQVS